ncbi:MAG: hypothetical protein AAF802_18565 [Planctomycetota bacterium]
MLARLKPITLLGIEARAVDIEVDISPAAMHDASMPPSERSRWQPPGCTTC